MKMQNGSSLRLQVGEMKTQPKLALYQKCSLKIDDETSGPSKQNGPPQSELR
jgi:hypothetical protein